MKLCPFLRHCVVMVVMGVSPSVKSKNFLVRKNGKVSGVPVLQTDSVKKVYDTFLYRVKTVLQNNFEC